MSSPTSLDSLRRSSEPLCLEELLKEHRLPLIPVYRRIPSRRNIVYTYLACLFPIQVWSYPQTFALFESVVIFFPFVLLSALLPRRWLRDKFVALTTGIVYLSAAWFILAHINDLTVRYWGISQFLPWMGLFLSSQILCCFLIQYSEKLESIILSFVGRVAVLSLVYLLIDLVSLTILVIRNT